MFTEDVEVLRELKAEFRAQERWDELAEVVERWVSTVEEPARREYLENELIDIYEFMLQLEDQKLVDQAELKLDDLYRARGTPEAYQALANLYLDCAERNADDLDAYVAARMACAAVFEIELKQPDGALLVMLTALGTDVLNIKSVLPEIERLSAKTGKWADSAQAVEAVLEAQPDVPNWVELTLRCGDWWSNIDLDEAKTRYRAAFDRDPQSIEAIERLERIFENSMDVAGRAELLRARGEASADFGQKATLFCEAGELYEQSMDRGDEAIDCYERAVEVANSPRALVALDRLYSASERWDELVRILKIQESLTDDIEQLNALQRRLADVLARAGAVDEAIRQYRDASASPKELIDTLKHEASSVQSEHDRGRLLAEVGKIYANDLGDTLSAHHYFQKALAIDSQIVDAAEPLADVFITEGRWDKAAPLLEAILRSADDRRSPAWLHMRNLQFAQACQATGRPGQALDAFRAAYEINPRDVGTLKGFGKALLDNQQWESSYRILTTLLDQHRQALDPGSVCAAHFMRGLCLFNVGDIDRAVPEFKKAVDINPRHRDALRYLADFFEDKEDWPNFVNYASKLVEVEPEPLVRFRQFVTLGEVWGQRLNRPDFAMQAYRGAIDIDPNSLVVLRRLLALYTSENKFDLAAKVIERLLQQETNPKRKANLHYTAGVIYRDHVRNGPEAVRHFEAALDSDWEMLKSFEAIDRLLTQAREWKELERSYRKMLKRIAEAPDPDDVRHIERLLWEGLGEIYRSRLGHFESAVNAYQILQNLRPDDLKISLILAELYEKTGDADGAIREHRRMIADNAMRVESYHALFEVYQAIGKWDESWCMSGALHFMRSANAREESWYQKYLGRNLKIAHASVTPELWRLLYHPDEDVLTGLILSYVAESLRGIYGNTIKGLGINPKKQAIAEDSKGVYRKLYDYVSRTLANPAPPALFKADDPCGLKNLNAEGPAVLVGTDRLNSQNDRENAFYLGKLLCGMRPDHYLATCGFPPQAIYTLFMAALESVEPSLKVSKQIKDANFNRAVKELRKLPDAAKIQLTKSVRQFLQRGTPVDIEGWLNAVDHTTTRFGFIMCGELALAGSCVRYGPIQMGSADDDTKLRELTLFAISTDYFKLRKQLRLSIGDSGPSPFM